MDPAKILQKSRFAHRLLMGQKGGRLGEQDGEGAQGEVLHRVGRVGPATSIRQRGQLLAQGVEPPIEERTVRGQRRRRQFRPSGRTNTSLMVVEAESDGPLRVASGVKTVEFWWFGIRHDSGTARAADGLN
jgi:hypothetical protein